MQCYWDIGPPCTVAGQLRPAAISSPRAVVPYVDFDKGWSSENQLNPLGNGQRETGSIESSLLVSRNAIFGLAMFGRVWLIYRFWDSWIPQVTQFSKSTKCPFSTMHGAIMVPWRARSFCNSLGSLWYVQSWSGGQGFLPVLG